MGFFSKVFKTIKKNFKRVGKWIKKGLMKVGKFMNKIGIVGQIALGLILPGIGSALGAWAGTTLAVGSTAGTIAKAAATFVNTAINVGSKVSSVFSTVTKGVGKVIGDTVGAVINKIPGASDLIQNITGKLGMKGGVGIDISGKTFSGAFKTAQNVLTDTVAAGKDLFSMDTLTGTNKFAIKAQLKKQLATDIGDPFRSTPQTMLEKIQATDLNTPKLADGSIDPFAIDPNMPIDSSISKYMGTTDLVASATPSSLLQEPTTIGDLFRSTPQTMLEKIQATNLNTKKLADGSIDPFAIDPNMPIDSSILETTGKKVAEKTVVEPESWIKKQIKTAVDKTVGTVTDLPSNLIKKEAGLIGPAEQGNVYSSTVVMEAPQPMQFETTDLTGGMPQGQNMLQGLSGSWGRGAWIYNAEQETQGFKQKQQQFANAGGM